MVLFMMLNLKIGSVRKKEKMYLVMPSKEMRDLYWKWLNTDDDVLKESVK